MYANVQGTDTGKARDPFRCTNKLAPEVGMKPRNRERYKELSEHAEVEDDPKKLRKIAKEVKRILEAEIKRLKRYPRQPSH